MSDRYDKLAPRDLIITMRSLARRFDEALGPVRSDPERFARRHEPVDGASLVDVVAAMGRHLGALESEISKLAHRSDPVVTASALAADPPPAQGAEDTLDAAQAAVSSSANAIGNLLDSASGEQWTHEAATGDGRKVTLTHVAQHAARVGAEGLRRVQSIADQL